MELPDGTILMHGTKPYDPAKAHEYYLRTRELKGRAKRQGFLTQKPSRSSVIKSPTFSVRLQDDQVVNLTSQQLAEQRALINQKVFEIKQSLKKLSTELRQAMSHAKEEKAKAEREAAKPDTAVEKSEAARESKKFREKHRQELSTKRKTEAKKDSAKADPVAELEEKISQVRDSLIAAVAKQRVLAAATRNS